VNTIFLDEDWDTVIVLDACRFDVFKQVYTEFDNLAEGVLEKGYRNESNTLDFVNSEMTGSYNHTIYSAHPGMNTCHDAFDYFAGDHFEEVVDLASSAWSEEVGTVKPEEFLEYDDFRNSVLWFMQPHSPYIGEITVKGAFESGVFEEDGWGYIKTSSGKFQDFCKEGYRYNLLRVLNVVNRIVDSLEGSVLVTSDHGELLGEKNVIGHPRGVEHQKLEEVPRLLINS
jgi:hypothetical protein